MPSPFPGMDPYLESPAFWPDFHRTFLVYLCDAILALLPDGYDVRIHERTATEEPEPVAIGHMVRGPHRERFAKIVQGPDRALVTVLELLSPSNKVGAGAAAYRANRQGLLLEGINLVEIDLLLRGRRLPPSRPLPPGDYYALILRSGRRPDCEVYAWTIRQPLPTLPIPLRAPGPDIPIELGAAFATAYERARYAKSLAYGEPAPAPVRDEDRDWVREQARRARP